ncbi:hypothetical protein SAMN02745704_00322 [Paucidesulfovibrio gracilis DSM 16080]|uniref:Uncharacterized protein n=1 Tax=Paucidesulfovibrio gracilis DSM 16080 TaxID=1121449 RepID=A0A1T4W4I6_9BACT|nr:hypothetical protein [Paucidesulfovibrio gracilis]SKA72234.1 hypothetical protein SAMN02745704_00322 [Paucidesulfovibrio gracilis DSM 16080]
MSVELLFTELVMLFCAVVLFFRASRVVVSLVAALRERMHRTECDFGHGDFYCFFHSRALTGR